jgi:hypothetical protein
MNFPKMLTCEEPIRLKLISEIGDDEVAEQIVVRKLLLKEMVGTLYPTILKGEIEILQTRKMGLLG